MVGHSEANWRAGGLKVVTSQQGRVNEAIPADISIMRALVPFLLVVLPAILRAQDPLPEPVRMAQEALRAAATVDYCERAIDLSKAFRNADLLDSAKAAAERALRHARNEREKARAQVAIAMVQVRAQDHAGAQEHARQAILLAHTAGDTSSWVRGESILSDVDFYQSRFTPAREHAETAIALAMAIRDSAALASTYNTLGNWFYVKHNYDSARWYYDASISFISPTETRRHARARLNQINLFIEEEKIDSAMARSDALREEVQRTDLHTRSQYHNQRGYALFVAGRFREAIREFTRSDSLNNADRAELGLRIENTGFLAESQAAIGDSAKAYLLMRDLEVLKDSFSRAAADEQMLTLEKKFETRLNKEEIARLGEDNRRKADRLRVQNLQLYGSLALAVLAIGAVILVWRNLRLKRKHEAVLMELNAALEDKQARIEEVNTLLRMKVLRTQMDPHFIHNCLNAIKSLSLSGEHAKAEDYLDGFARLLRQVLEHSVRDRITLDEELDFLRNYVMLEGLRMKGELQWSVEADPQLLKEEPMIPSLLVQPFVENAIWHGLAPKEGPKRLSVRFASDGGRVTCIVQDNGVGRSAKTDRPGRTSLGLKLTGERLALLTERMEKEGAFVIEDLKDAEGGPAGTRVMLGL